MCDVYMYVCVCHIYIRCEQLEAVKEELVVQNEEVSALRSRVDQLAKAKVCHTVACSFDGSCC